MFIKKGSLVLIISILLVVIPLTTYFVIESSGENIKINQEKIHYNLPYPGLLPDHPLYFVKIIRDRLIEFLTRDNLKKAQLFLLYSDKRAAMSLNLARKGKSDLSLTTFSKGEKYFLKIVNLLQQEKKRGNQAPSSFIETLKLANAKHYEMINELIKLIPEGKKTEIDHLLELNLSIKKQLETLP